MTKVILWWMKKRQAIQKMVLNKFNIDVGKIKLYQLFHTIYKSKFQIDFSS